MADIKAIKGTDNTTYSIVDRFSEWGGYNYLPASKGEFTGTVPTSGSNDFKSWSSVVTVNPNETWTISFDAKSSTTGTLMWVFFYNNASNIVQVSSGIASTGQTTTRSDGGVQLALTDEYIRYWITWTFNSSAAASKSIICGRLSTGTNNGSTATVKNVKLERGHKATDWSPCWTNIFTYNNETITMNI